MPRKLTKPAVPAAKPKKANGNANGEEPKQAPSRHPGGRPATYKPEFAAQAAKACELGATDNDLAEIFDVTVRSIHFWKISHPEFLHSLKIGREAADNRVERSLFQRAIGYSQDSVKVFLSKEGTPVYAPYREHIPPDTTACIFWLKNRKPAEWRDVNRTELAGQVALQPVGPPMAPAEVAAATRDVLRAAAVEMGLDLPKAASDVTISKAIMGSGKLLPPRLYQVINGDDDGKL
jgi:hypothetical protein